MVVGDGPVRSQLELLATKLGVARKLLFTGVLPRAEVPSAAVAFDIALQTALVPYASPLCLFEYMAMGQAILAPDQPNHHEVLVSGNDCEMYDPTDPTSIESKLEALITDPHLRRLLGHNARQALMDRGYFWERNANRVLESATELLAASGKRDRR